MKDSRELHEGELKGYEDELRGLKSYIKELKDKTAEHGTDQEHFERDLLEAEHNVTYYEGEIARIEGLMGKGDDGGATYWVYEDSAGEWRWQLRAANNLIIADSGEGYRDKQDCLHGISLVKDSRSAPVKDRK